MDLAAGLTSELRELGVKPGDLIMVHASLRKLGLATSSLKGNLGLTCGADLLIDAIDAAVGPAGSWLMVLGSEYAQDWVNERPVEERAGLLAGTEPFDAANAPAMKDVGWLAEAFRRREGTLLSANPSGRFGARGARAAALLQGQPWNDYYGPGSPLEKFTHWGGKVLRLGADPDTVTVLHYAEYLADLPDKRRTRWDYLLATPDGPKQVWIECLDDLNGIADYAGEDYFAAILGAFLAQGRGRRGTVGAAQAELLEAAELVAFGARWMEANLHTKADFAPSSSPRT